jgi:hypothetical protein
MNLAEVETAEGKLDLFVGIYRSTSLR